MLILEQIEAIHYSWVKYMSKTGISLGAWNQVHSHVLLGATAGCLTLNSSAPNSLIDCMANMAINLKTAKSFIQIQSSEQSDAMPPESGSISLYAGGIAPKISLVSLGETVGGASLLMSGPGLSLTAGVSGKASVLNMGMQSVSLTVAGATQNNGINITPDSIQIRVGATCIQITEGQILLTCGGTTFSLIPGGISETVDGTSGRSLSSTGNVFFNSSACTIKTAENIFSVSAESIAHTAAIFQVAAESMVSVTGSDVSITGDASASVIGAMTEANG